jgi:hypothetical protein
MYSTDDGAVITYRVLHEEWTGDLIRPAPGETGRGIEISSDGTPDGRHTWVVTIAETTTGDSLLLKAFDYSWPAFTQALALFEQLARIGAAAQGHAARLGDVTAALQHLGATDTTPRTRPADRATGYQS